MYYVCSCCVCHATISIEVDVAAIEDESALHALLLELKTFTRACYCTVAPDPCPPHLGHGTYRWLSDTDSDFYRMPVNLPKPIPMDDTDDTAPQRRHPNSEIMGMGYRCQECTAVYNYIFNYCPDCGHRHAPEGKGYDEGLPLSAEAQLRSDKFFGVKRPTTPMK